MPKGRAAGRVVLSWDATAHIHADARGRFVCGALLADGVPFVSWDALEFASACGDARGLVWWFGAGRYEFGWLWTELLKLGGRPTKRTRDAGTETTSLRIRKAEHRDAARLWLVPLATFSPTPPPPVGLPCSCGHACGGLCAIVLDLPEESRPSVEAHGIATCEAIEAGLVRLRDAQRHLDLDGCNSLGSTAWASARRRYDLGDVEPSRSAHEFNRESAGAARVEVIRPRVERSLKFDISSAYVGACARIDFPIGGSTRLWGDAARRAFDAGTQGIIDAEVYAPDAFLPILPVRSRRTGKLAFPTGPLHGRWTRDELRYAVDHGYKLDRVHSGQFWRTSGRILEAWAESLWRARRRYEKEGNPLAKYVKALGVALPGVFGSNPYAEQLLWSPNLATMRRCPCKKLGRDGDCPCRGTCCGGCRGLCGEPKPASRDQDVWVRKFYLLLGRAHAEWYSPVLGWCRVEVHRFATQNGDGSDLVSIHTDECQTLRPRVVPARVGHGLWRAKGALREAVPGAGVLTPHANASVGRDEETGELVMRAAGTARSQFGRPIRTEEQIARRMVNAYQMRREASDQVWIPVGRREGLQSIAGGEEVSPKFDVRRDRNGMRWLGPRILEEGADVTRAPTIEELEGYA